MNVNIQALKGNWNEIKGKLRNKWGQLTNDDLQQARGNIDQLVGLIQRKTGEARTSVEKFLEVEVTMFSVPEEVARALWYKSVAYDKLSMAAGREQALKDLVEFYPGSEWASRHRPPCRRPRSRRAR